MNVETDSGLPPQRSEPWVGSPSADRLGRRRRAPRRSLRRSAPPHTQTDHGLTANVVLDLVAHELSGPLTTIAVAADLLRSTTAQDGPLLDVMETQIRRLHVTVADLLDMSRADRDRIVPRAKRESALGITLSALRSLEDEIAAEWVSVNLPAELPRVWVDRVFAERIVVNLLRNAARHGAPPIDIDLTSTASHVVIAVRDQGAGIGGSAVAGLFEPYRPHGESGRLGLGLALSRTLARAMGGDVTLESVQPTTFMVTLPVAREVLR